MINNFFSKKYADFLICLTLYGAAFTASLLFLLFIARMTTVESLDVDESYYYQQAITMVQGDHQINTYRPIGFPLVLAGSLYLAHSNLFWAKVLLILISSFRGPLVYLLVRKIIGNHKVALFSALVVIFWPTIVYYSTTIYSESISLTFFLTFLCLLPLGNKNTKIYQWIISGLFLGMTILIHPMYLLFIPFVLLIVGLEEKHFKLAFKHFCILMLGTIGIIAPWSLAISLHENSFYLLSTNGPDALAGGLNNSLIERGYQVIEAPNGRLTIVGPGMWTHEHYYLTPEENLLPPKERNALLSHRIEEWVKTHPYDALYLEGAKIANLWGFYPMFWSLKYRIFFGNIPILIIFLLGVMAVWKWRKNYRELSRFWTIPLFISAVALISLGSWRYRLPGDVALIVLSMMMLFQKDLKQTSDNLLEIESR